MRRLVQTCLLLATLTLVIRVNAAELKSDCNSVQKIASISFSSKLILSMAGDTTKQYCHFFVSMPPPYSIRASVDAWYNDAIKKRSNDLIVSLVSDLAVAPIPESDSKMAQEVRLRIADSSDVVTKCVFSLFDKNAYAGKGKDGQLTCAVSPAAELAVLTVSIGQDFKSAVFLPRPAT
jgi:hypothetical protein